jgi:2-C-methyl-D-erythritol 4-phosphate cytidylyltransferase
VPVVWTIVVAGGSGQRFGQLKQFADLAGRPVVSYSVEASRPFSAGVILVVPSGAEAEETHGADAVVEGGTTRSESVRRGLGRVPAEADVVVVHDAARPLASTALFRAVIDALQADDVDAAVPGVPVSDTIKQIDSAHNVTGTHDRSALVAVQTPQAFRAGVLRRAHEGGSVATDDAALVERVGGTVRVVPGEARNIKITTREDLQAAERLMAAGE